MNLWILIRNFERKACPTFEINFGLNAQMNIMMIMYYDYTDYYQRILGKCLIS